MENFIFCTVQPSQNFLKSIPFCIARRICAIVENPDIKSLRLEKLKTLLISQKYLKEIVTQGMKKASIVLSEVLRFEKAKENKQVIPFISTYNPNNPNLFPLIRKSFNSFQHGTTTKDLFQKYKLIDCKRQPANLGQLLGSPK